MTAIVLTYLLAMVCLGLLVSSVLLGVLGAMAGDDELIDSACRLFFVLDHIAAPTTAAVALIAAYLMAEDVILTALIVVRYCYRF